MLYDAKRWEPKVEAPKKAKKKVAKVITKATYRRRLLKLATLLEHDAKNAHGLKFDLGVVGFKSGEIFPYWGDGGFEPQLDCGTTGCAMGLAAISGEFKEEGLSFKIVGGVQIDTTINGRQRMYDQAAMAVFGLTMKQAHFLFDPQFYPVDKKKGAVAERYVASRIRRFVAEKADKQIERLIKADKQIERLIRRNPEWGSLAG